MVPAAVVPNGLFDPLPAAPSFSVPRLMVVVPLYVLTPDRVQVLVLLLVTAPTRVPEPPVLMTPVTELPGWVPSSFQMFVPLDWFPVRLPSVRAAVVGLNVVVPAPPAVLRMLAM